MTFAATLDDQGRVLIPREIRESLGLVQDAEVEVQVVKKTKARPNLERLKNALIFYGGSRRQSFLADGYTSVEAYMDDLRGR